MKISREYLIESLILIIAIWAINLIAILGYNSAIISINTYTYFVSLSIIVSFILAFFVAIMKYGIVSLQALFLACMFLFNYGRIFLFIIGKFDYTNSPYSWISSFKWESSTILKVDNYYLIFNTIFLIGLLLGKRNSFQVEKNRRMSGDFNCLNHLFVKLYFITLPFMVCSLLSFSIYIMESGYGILYTGGLASFAGNLVFKISRLLFNVCYYTICMTEMDEKRFSKIGYIYIATNAIQLLQGSRGYFIIAILSFFYIRYRRFGKSVNLRAAALLIAIFVPGIYLIACFRNGNISDFNISDSITYFFSEMSGSLNVPAYYLQNKDNLIHNKIPYIFDPIVRIFNVALNPEVYNMGQSIDYINVTSNLGHILTYNISEAYYLTGNNIASNFIAEMSEFGVLGVVFGSCLFSYMLNIYDKKFDTHPFLAFMSYEFILKILYASRGEMFYDSYNFIKYFIIYCVIRVLGNVIYNSNKRQRAI